MLDRLLLCLVLFAAGYFIRWGQSEAAWLEKERERELATAEDYRLRQKAAQFNVQKTEEKKREVQRNFEQITGEIRVLVTNEFYGGACLDADGLRLWNDANTGRHVGLQRPEADGAAPGDSPPAHVDNP